MHTHVARRPVWAALASPHALARTVAVLALMLAGLAGGQAARADGSMPGMHMSSGESMPGTAMTTTRSSGGMSDRSMPGRTTRAVEPMPGMRGDEHGSTRAMNIKPGESMAGMRMNHAHASKQVGAQPAMTMDERHGPASSATRWAVIGGFLAIMLIALGSAAALRRRPAAAKRRDALARLRASHLNPSASEAR